jgi:hypothetical protein
MIIHIGNHDFTELWDWVYYKALSNYPNISDWEIKNIIDFINYENLYNRRTELKSDNEDILKHINQELLNKDKYANVSKPEKITECTACKHGGCLTRFLCHTASIDNAIKIFECGELLSAVNARKLPAEELKKEPRNMANDPVDFFDYVMFSWGNCQAGDRLVMERKMNRTPTEEDLSINFIPGVRFYFEYEKLNKHPNAMQDGFHPMKIKVSVCLVDYVYAIIIPLEYEDRVSKFVPIDLKDKVHYLENNCKDIWDWSEKVYQFIEIL